MLLYFNRQGQRAEFIFSNPQFPGRGVNIGVGRGGHIHDQVNHVVNGNILIQVIRGLAMHLGSALITEINVIGIPSNLAGVFYLPTSRENRPPIQDGIIHR